MPELLADIEQAVALHVQGRPDQALAAAEKLLAQARGTPHAAAIYRHTAEFLHATGQYSAARELAQEAGSLARATRHPDEILAATLVVLQAELYEGHVAGTHRQLSDLLELAPDQPLPLLAMGRLLLLVGEADAAVVQLEHARGLLDEFGPLGTNPALDLHRAQALLAEARASLMAGRDEEAVSRAERAAALELPTRVPAALGRALAGLALAHGGRAEAGRRAVVEALALGQTIGGCTLGHCLALSGALELALGQAPLGAERLRASLELVPHALERQEACYHLGRLAVAQGDRHAAETWLRRAAEPTVETHFGRLSVRGLRELLGLRAL
jgi:tetratricopeptide (TPR) repeat protein